jgi:site-specific DNA-methyltransferase (adenine-specific)
MLIWVKDTKTRAKASNNVPMAQYEEISVFRVNKYGNKDRHQELREYFMQELIKSGMSVLEIKNATGNKAADHFFRYTSDFRIPTADVYRRLQAATGGFSRTYDEIRRSFDSERQNLCTYNRPPDNTNVIYCPTTKGKERLHPSQKPIPLLERIITAYADAGDTILDNCAGSGATGEAAEYLGRNSILIEREPKYCEIIKKRLTGLQMQASLFG